MRKIIGATSSVRKAARLTSIARAFGTASTCVFAAARFQPKNRFAFLHQVETIARDCFQIRRIGFEQIDFARLAGEQRFLLVHLSLASVSISPRLCVELFIRRNEQTNDNQQDRDEEQHAQNAIETLPDGGFATRAKIAVAGVIH